MSLLKRKAALLAKIETTYGVDPTPTGGANAILVSDVNISPMEMKTEDRALLRPFLGNNEQLPTGLFSKLDFTCEIAGSGAKGTAPAWGPLIRACGFAETITAATKVEYTPVSSDMESVTQYLNLDGVLHKLTGARGTVSFDFTKDTRPKMKFSFTGLFNAVTDAASPVVDYAAWIKPLPVNKTNTPTLTVDSYAAAVHSLSFDMANAVVYRELLNDQAKVLITDRKPSGQIVMEAVTVATKNWWSVIKDVVTGPLHLVHGLVDGNIVELEAINTQLIKPQYQDQDGIAMLQCGTVYTPSATGNDELVITVR